MPRLHSPSSPAARAARRASTTRLRRRHSELYGGHEHWSRWIAHGACRSGQLVAGAPAWLSVSAGLRAATGRTGNTRRSSPRPRQAACSTGASITSRWSSRPGRPRMRRPRERDPASRPRGEELSLHDLPAKVSGAVDKQRVQAQPLAAGGVHELHEPVEVELAFLPDAAVVRVARRPRLGREPAPGASAMSRTEARHERPRRIFHVVCLVALAPAYHCHPGS